MSQNSKDLQESAGDQPKKSTRGRGRPALGKKLLIRLDDSERDTAEQLGDGVAAEGIRRALRATRFTGVEFMKRVAYKTD